MNEQTSLWEAAELKDLAEMRHFVEGSLNELKVDDAVQYGIVLAVDELVSNVVEHGYQGGAGLVEITIQKHGEDLIIFVRDQAPPFDPLTVPEPDISVPLEKRQIGGLGVYLARHYLDRVEHRITARGGNELKLTKSGIFSSS
jgi:serine/threonine-protein kinase RsbW